MKYKITLPDGNNHTGIYLSIPFVNGVGETDNDFIADKAKLKGFEVETEEPAPAFKCPHCSVTCKSEENLQKHIDVKHKDKQPNGADAEQAKIEEEKARKEAEKQALVNDDGADGNG